MDRLSQTFKHNVKFMKSRVTKYAIYGVIIAFAALILATFLSSFFQFGDVTLDSIVKTQQTNVTLWFLDLMPFVFAFWGQYTSSMMAYEASAMVIDQTEDLRNQTNALEYKAAHDATHDVVTDLPNRILLLDRLEQSIQSAVRQKSAIALLTLEIDNFQDINDTLGHHSGDRLLKQVVSRLQGMVRKSDTLARIGGDEFVILIQDVVENDSIIRVIENIQRLFLEPFSIEGLTFEVQTSIGVAICPDHGREVDTIMQRANVALYAAKQDSKKYAVYTSKMDKHSPHRLTLMGELRQAIENDELILCYQPKIDLNTRTVKGAEALVRWNHPQHGLMSPDEFIPMAERTGLIRPLSIWVLKNALNQAVKWHKNDIKLNVAINLSPTAFLDTELPDVIIGMLSHYEISANYVTLEITEGSMIKDPDLAMEILNRLANRKVQISIDDFGTGYSSLSYLKRLPVSEIKIDKSFVTDMLESENDAVIVKAIVDLGHNLSMNVVAEGVESKETAVQLKKLGCDVIQGFYFSKPLESDKFFKWLLKRKFSEGPYTPQWFLEKHYL